MKPTLRFSRYPFVKQQPSIHEYLACEAALRRPELTRLPHPPFMRDPWTDLWLPLWMITGPVQQATAGDDGTNGTNVVTISAPGAGNFLALCASIGIQSKSISTVAGGGVTWTRRAQNTASSTASCTAEIWEGLNSSGSGTTVTVTWSATGTSSFSNVSEWSGIATSSAFDVAENTSVGNTVSPVSGPGTTATTNANDLLIGAFGEASTGAPSAGPTNSFTGLTGGSGGTNNYTGCAYRIVSATGSYSTGWTITKNRWAGVFASFKAAAGGGGRTTKNTRAFPLGTEIGMGWVSGGEV